MRSSLLFLIVALPQLTALSEEVEIDLNNDGSMYNAWCGRCHGLDGKGMGTRIPSIKHQIRTTLEGDRERVTVLDRFHLSVNAGEEGVDPDGRTQWSHLAA